MFSFQTTGAGMAVDRQSAETPDDLRRRAQRVRRLIGEMRQEREPVERLTKLAEDLEARAARIETGVRPSHHH